MAQFSPSAGLLLSAVGKTLERSQLTGATLISVFSLMNDLHQLGVIHGDPRINNIVQVSGAPADLKGWKWIDLRQRPTLKSTIAVTLHLPRSHKPASAAAAAAPAAVVRDIDGMRLDWQCLLMSLACISQLPVPMVSLVEQMVSQLLTYESFRDAAIILLGSVAREPMPHVQRSYRARMHGSPAPAAVAAASSDDGDDDMEPTRVDEVAPRRQSSARGSKRKITQRL